jgi:hypothetical protein
MSASSDDYQVSPRGYLRRCRDQLLDGSKASLFYAALELRNCVEARLAEYLEHYELHTAEIQAFKIGYNAKAVDKMFDSKQIVHARITTRSGDVLDQYHTPVPAELESYCKRHVDDLRHCQAVYRKPDDPWWNETREQLVAAYRLAWVACRGEMPVPPLVNFDTGECHPFTFLMDKDERDRFQPELFQAGVPFELAVDYLDEAPVDWRPDL